MVYRCSLFLGFILSLLTAPAHLLSEETVALLDQAQSHISLYKEMPLISANYSGAFRPYLLKGEQLTLLTEGIEIGEKLDLLSPLALNDGKFLAVGEQNGSGVFDIFLIDTAKKALKNITNTVDQDEGNPCVSPSKKLLSFSGSGQHFYDLETSTPLKSSVAKSSFRECLFTDENTLFGITQNKQSLFKCERREDQFVCLEVLSEGKDSKLIHLFFREKERKMGAIGVIGRLPGREHYRPYNCILSAKKLEPFRVSDSLETTDILEVKKGREGSDLFRLGSKARYFLSSVGQESSATVYQVEPVGKRLFAIVATEKEPRGLAEWKGERWQFFRTPSRKQVDAPEIQEVTLRSKETGNTYPALYFGPKKSSSVVVWIHGGPRENVSPRFNPYFYQLKKAGYSVLALNYPGSTGFGARYEAQYAPKPAIDNIKAATDYLAAQGVRTVIVWAVSSGSEVLNAWLLAKQPLSMAIVSGEIGKVNLKKAALKRGVPLFGIRGRFDEKREGAKVDFWYDGGHDLTREAHFQALFKALVPQLKKVSQASQF